MRLLDGIPSESLERREMQLILFACLAIIVLATEEVDIRLSHSLPVL